jgi:hypothetical protein
LGATCGKEKSMTEKSLTHIFGRFLIAWLLVSIFFFLCGEWIIQALLPYLTFVTHSLAHHYSAELNIVDNPTGKIISIVATATEDVYRLSIPIAPKGTQVNGSGTLLHALVPIVILFTILFSWPVELKKMFAQVLLGLPFTLLILALTTPPLLTSHIEHVFHTAAQNYAEKDLPMPFAMKWVVFMEMGGVWLLPIISAFLCVKANGLFAGFSRSVNPS